MDTLADLTKDFPNLPSGDLNQVWKVLSQLQNSNPEKYRQFLGRELVKKCRNLVEMFLIYIKFRSLKK